ncbi:hypothetical protein COK91_03085 [Bacillus cereus]|uniref:hypothetical protein n=1 Tax=Bacillus cereus TaxID=1396 RepID=UPI000BFA6309|nr:hypothetical protein [Bacillus cereus]PFU84647.1 hypothetical protein COK91_03085 [Bacillus cereus]
MIRKIEIFLADVLFLISINCAIVSGRLMRHGDESINDLRKVKSDWLKKDAFKLREEEGND